MPGFLVRRLEEAENGIPELQCQLSSLLDESNVAHDQVPALVEDLRSLGPGTEQPRRPVRRPSHGECHRDDQRGTAGPSRGLLQRDQLGQTEDALQETRRRGQGQAREAASAIRARDWR